MRILRRKRRATPNPLDKLWPVLTAEDKTWINKQLDYCGVKYPPQKPSGLIEAAPLQYARYAQTMPVAVTNYHPWLPPQDIDASRSPEVAPAPTRSGDPFYDQL